jgi:predicted peroxiredoxin
MRPSGDGRGAPTRAVRFSFGCFGYCFPMQIVYMATAGSKDPTRASIPWHLAVNGSIEVGQEAAVVLAGDATELLVGTTAESLEGLGVPPMRELLGKARDLGMTVHV